MARADNTYSQIVAGMKILLPLAALGLLSTLFLISNTVDPSDSVPIAPIDLEQRAQDLGVTRPSFAGVSGRGDEIILRADAARPERDRPERLVAERVTGEIGLADGAGLRLRATTARLDQTTMTATLEGGCISPPRPATRSTPGASRCGSTRCVPKAPGRSPPPGRSAI